MGRAEPTRNGDMNRDERLEAATRLARDASPEQMHDLRVFVGSISRFGARGTGRFARLWNWLIDAEYVAIGPPPITWVILSAMAVPVLLIALMAVLI